MILQSRSVGVEIAMAVLLLSAVQSAPAGETECDPRIIGSLGGSPNDIEIVGDRAYIAARRGGLIVLSMMDPARPTLLGRVYSHTEATAVAVHGRVALVTDPYFGVLVVDKFAVVLPAA